MIEHADMYEMVLAGPWMRAACDLFGITEEELRRPNRRPAAVQMRRALVAVLCDDAGLSPAAIGRVLGRHHSTITYHEQMAGDPTTERIARAIRNRHALNAGEEARTRRMAVIQERLGRVYRQEAAG